MRSQWIPFENSRSHRSRYPLVLHATRATLGTIASYFSTLPRGAAKTLCATRATRRHSPHDAKYLISLSTLWRDEAELSRKELPMDFNGTHGTGFQCFLLGAREPLKGAIGKQWSPMSRWCRVPTAMADLPVQTALPADLLDWVKRRA
jgi:hypothetical protein